MKSRNLMSPLHVKGTVRWWCHKTLIRNRLFDVVLAIETGVYKKFCSTLHPAQPTRPADDPLSFVSFDSLRTYLSNIAIEWK